MASATRTIRDATHNDIAAILELYAETGLDDGVKLPSGQAKDIFRQLTKCPDYRTFVVTDETGAVCATYALLLMYGMAHAGAPLAIVEHVAVATREQGKGVGSLMMRHAMEIARASGCYKLALSSNVRREQAHAFYDGLGFTRHGYSFVVGLVPGRQHDIFSD